MDRVFLEYYEEELRHIRHMGREFAALHPGIAEKLSLDTLPCPDPYVERLLEGVAFLTARARLKVDGESSRFARSVLEALYPDLVGPAPAMTMAVLHPGPQVGGMQDGHRVGRGTRLNAALREGISTRVAYTTAHEVHLWPVRIAGAGLVQDRGSLRALGLSDAAIAGAEAGLRILLSPQGHLTLDQLSLDRLDLHFASPGLAGALFDAMHGAATGGRVRAAGGVWREIPRPAPLGMGEDEALLARSRPTFEGFRLLREYFLMPERFYNARLSGLNPALREAGREPVEIVVLFDRPCRDLADVSASDLALFATPVVNLFEKECSAVDLDPREGRQVLHADRARPRDYEIYQVLAVEDAESEGPGAEIPALFSLEQNRGTGLVYATERRPRRMDEEETRRGQYRSTYPGDEMFVSVSRPAGSRGDRTVRRLDIRALCTNRDLPLIDDTPILTLESGDPVSRVELLRAFRRPRPSLPAALPTSAVRDTRRDELSWRLVAQLSLNHLSLAEETGSGEPLRAMLDLYADRGDPGLARHVRAIGRVSSRQVVERLAMPGPLCFGQGVEITLDVDESVLTGQSRLLLTAILARLFARHAGINSFVRTRTRLTGAQEEVAWPLTLGERHAI